MNPYSLIKPSLVALGYCFSQASVLAQIICPNYNGYGSAAVTYYAQCHGEYSQVTVTGENVGGYMEGQISGNGGWFGLDMPMSLIPDTYVFTFFTSNQACTVNPGATCVCTDGPNCCQWEYYPWCDCTSWQTTHTQTIVIPDVPCTLSPYFAVTPPSAYGCADGIVTYNASTSACAGYGFLLGGAPPENYQWYYHESGQGSTITGLVAGTYDAHWNGCTESYFDVVVPNGPCTISGSATSTDASGSVCADGTIQVMADRGASCLDLYACLEVNGTVHLSEQIAGTSGTALFTGLAPGDYEVHVRLGNNYETECEYVQMMHVGAPACTFPFTIDVDPAQFDQTWGCAGGAVTFTNNTDCYWWGQVFNEDTISSSGFYLGSEPYTLSGGATPTPGTYLVQAYGQQWTANGILECSAWGSFTVECGGIPTLQVRCALEGPFQPTTGEMSDALRSSGLVPLNEPYQVMGYGYVPGYFYGSGAQPATTETVLDATGSDAIVDWVIIELRAAASPSDVACSRVALLQRDGDVVDVDGMSAVSFVVSQGSYHVAVRHRNHLGVMTLDPMYLGASPVSIDFTDPATLTYGSQARKTIGLKQVLWSGDVSFGGELKYTGSGNDRDPILVTVGSTTPNNVVSNVYSTRDVNLNGQVKYTGSGNDRDPILVNVGSTTPNNVRTEQLP